MRYLNQTRTSDLVSKLFLFLSNAGFPPEEQETSDSLLVMFKQIGLTFYCDHQDIIKKISFNPSMDHHPSFYEKLDLDINFLKKLSLKKPDKILVLPNQMHWQTYIKDDYWISIEINKVSKEIHSCSIGIKSILPITPIRILRTCRSNKSNGKK